MTSLEARRSVRDLTSGRPDGEGAGELSDALRWIARDVLAPLAHAIEPGALVTLMPIGELNLLPLHAAGLERAATGAAFRYAPYARALLRAQAAARGLGGPELRLLSVAGASPVGDEPAVDACRAVAELFGRTGAAPAPVATSNDAMLGSIGDAPIWHLACAADHEPILPLTSALVLADGWLGLRTLRAHEHPTQRLAFVATCRAAAPDDDVLDEGVRLAIALLDCGVAGVVAPDGMVAPRAARLLALRFFSLYLEGLAPPRALAAAQAWLATATNGEVSDAFGDLHPSPPGERSADRRRWRSARAFTDPRDWALYSYAGA